MANAHGHEFWERLVREVRAGARQVDVARRHGVSTSRLSQWCQRAKAARPESVALLPVQSVMACAPRRFELVVTGARVSFEEGADPEYVASLARALQS
jgi:transposase-like protein